MSTESAGGALLARRCRRTEPRYMDAPVKKIFPIEARFQLNPCGNSGVTIAYCASAGHQLNARRLFEDSAFKVDEECPIDTV